ncbi:hypothetical protein [Cupriavidus lacunae]|uniref:hypothetical protein n=1 Tax=Cupriavidus lacunae TaxID=2666307 RepID=UPI001058614F|nr:hypothetical protein [Cupriavidus lacunae]
MKPRMYVHARNRGTSLDSATKRQFTFAVARVRYAPIFGRSPEVARMTEMGLRIQLADATG